MSSSYKEKSRDADFKQHANKIYTAIREIVPEYAEKRAIWELFQNALDVIDENGIIKISRTNQGLKFEHNGKPFTDGNLTGLIKQTSDGKVYGSNEVTAGQYGTGFLSTHVYGKTVILNASLFTDSGKIKHLKNFVIDRHAQKPEDLFIKIQTQDENAENICDTEGNEIDRHLVFTSFEYIGCNGESVHIDNMLTYLPNILPYIFTFNNKLDCVEVYNNEHPCTLR